MCASWLSDTFTLEIPPVDRVRSFLESRGGAGQASNVVLPLPPSTLEQLKRTLQWDNLQHNVAAASSMEGAEEVLRVIAAALHADERIVGPSESWTAIVTDATIVRILEVRQQKSLSFLLVLVLKVDHSQFRWLVFALSCPSVFGLAGARLGACLTSPASPPCNVKSQPTAPL